jgi:hypothetical protein
MPPPPRHPFHGSEPSQAAGRESLTALLDRTFIAQRALLLELAAFLDRCDRAEDADRDAAEPDPRLTHLRACLPILHDRQPQRARRILERLSDPTPDLLDHATPGPATGAPPPGAGEAPA